VGEGGKIERSEIEPGEGECLSHREGPPHPPSFHSSALSHIRAFTLVFDELWGEGKKCITTGV
jgi:hypothetical protein